MENKLSDFKSHLVLAIDLGTSGPKVAIASLGGKIIDAAVGSTPIFLLPDGGAEQDPGTWWEAIKKTTRSLLARHPDLIENIAAVCCTTQWSGTVPVDQMGNPLANAIIWMDARGAKYLPKIVGGPLQVAGYRPDKLWNWIHLTGGAPSHSGKDSIAHILYLKEEQPELYKATYKFLEPKDYLNLRLTGRFAASYESITLHWVTDNRNINNIIYSDPLLKMAGIDRQKLPDLKQATANLGPILPEVAEELGLPHHTQVIMGTPDMHSAAIGSGGIQDYDAHLYIGTSSWLSCHVPYKKTDIAHNMASLPSAVPGRYFIVNEQETAGASLRYLKENILYYKDELQCETIHENIYQVFDHIAAQVPAGSNGVIFTPWLNGERTPVDDHKTRGGFFNLSLHHTRPDLIRAVFEGVAFNSRWLLYYVEKFIGRPFPAINMIGGGANSDIWCQIHADILNKRIRQVKDPLQANTRGAAILAGVALGATTFEEAASQTEIKQEFTPNPTNRELYDNLFDTFLAIYKRNKKIHARLRERF
jgi:xylulokinase